MMMFWFSFATILMSAFFIKDLLAKRFEIYGEERKKWTIRLGAALGGITLIAMLFSIESFATSFSASMMGGGNADQIFKMNFGKNFVPNLWLWWLFCAVALGMLVAVVNGKLKPQTLVYALIIMGAIDAIKVNNQFIKVDPPQKYYFRNDPVLTELKREFDKAPFRVFSLPGTFPMQSQEGVYELESVSGYHDNELNSYRAFRGDQSDVHYINDIVETSRDGQMRISMMKIMGNTPFMDIGDVKYILHSSGSGGVSKIENRTTLGRLSYAADYVVMAEDDIAPALRRRTYDYRTTIVLLEEPELPFTRGKPIPAAGTNAGSNDADDNAGDDIASIEGWSAEGETKAEDDGGRSKPASAKLEEKKLKVEWKKYKPNVRVAAITMPDDGFLRLSEVHYPGWRISVDGTPVKYYRSDLTWMAVPLKAGSYEIKMEPRSLYLDMSLAVSGVSTLLVIAILAFAYMRRRKTAGNKAAVVA